MKLASYTSNQSGLRGLLNILIRWRLSGPYSHNEVVFEPSDGVDALMPDRTCQPDAAGALWCASSVATERLPTWSAKRAGARGGVRFKRIVLNPAKWDVIDYPADPMEAAMYFSIHEGWMYDWALIFKFVNWLIPQNAQRLTCSEVCAAAGGYGDAWRFDPCVLHVAVKRVQTTLRT